MKIINLPCEIVTEILSQLDEVQDLKAPLLSCRLFHDAFTQRPRLAQQIVRKQIPKQLLPYAVVLTYASRVHISNSTYNFLSLKPEDADTMVFRFMFEGGAVSTSNFQTFSLPQLMAMGATHELITDVASNFARKAWVSLSDILDDPISTKSTPSHPDLSQKEWLRFCRCFYRVELYYGLLSNYMFEERDVHVTQGNNPLEPAIQFEERDKWYPATRTLDVLVPWEIEQMETAIGYLSDIFMESAKGLPVTNGYTGKWHCKGLRFLRKFEKMPYAEKRELLVSEVSIFCFSLFMEFLVYRPTSDMIKALQDTELDVSLQLPNLVDMDADEGPRKGFEFLLDCVIIHGVSQDENRRLKEQAYLFWDHERLEKYDMCSTKFIRPPFWGVYSSP